jgi:hypothetical protein
MRLALQLLPVMTVVACRGTPMNTAAFSTAANVAIISVQGNQGLEVDCRNSVMVRECHARTGTDLGLGANLLVYARGWVESELMRRFHLGITPQESVASALAPVHYNPNPMEGMLIQHKVSLKGTMTLAPGEARQKVMGQVASWVHADLALWMDLGCQVRMASPPDGYNGATADVQLALTDPQGNLVVVTRQHASSSSSGTWVDTNALSVESAGLLQEMCASAVQKALKAALDSLPARQP